MSRRRLGIAAGRRGVCAVGLERNGREYALRARWCIARAPGEALPVALERLCAAIPEEWRATELHLALSPADLACADLFEVSYRNEHQLTRVAGSLAEGRCAGETVEELAIDVLMTGRAGAGARLQLAAMRSARLKELNGVLVRLLSKSSVELVTAMPFALLRAAPEGDGLWGVSLGVLGEGAVWERKGGDVRALRAFPMDGQPDDRLRLLEQNAHALNSKSDELRVLDGPAPVRGLGSEGVAPEEMAAVGAALSEPERSLNLLRGTSDAPRSILDHIRAPLLASAVAATVFLVTLGLYCDLHVRQQETDLSRCREKEQEVWKAVFANESYNEGALLSRLQQGTARKQKIRQANDQPSALRLWAELSAAMPNPERIGLTLEELDLTRRGGRLQARVPASEGNPLQNASQLEAAINQSATVAARGEFERRDGQIAVRMQFDYKAKAGQGSAP